MKLNVSKQSWHYWLASQASSYEGPPENLCGYFWKVVLGAVLILIIILVLLFYLVIVLSIPLHWWYDIFSGPAFASAVLHIAALYSILQGKVSERKLSEKSKGLKRGPAYALEPSFLGLFQQWVKAKKSKICPSLEFH